MQLTETLFLVGIALFQFIYAARQWKSNEILKSLD